MAEKLTKEEVKFIYDTLSLDFKNYKRVEELYNISFEVLMDKLGNIIKEVD